MLRFVVLLATLMAMLIPSKLAAETLDVDAAGFPATLVEPRADAPILLFIAGSGPTDRDGDNPFGVKASYLAKLAAELGELGIGSLRFDKRGVPGSQPVLNEADMTFETFGNDAAAVLDWLRTRFRTNPILVLGHSEGGLVALFVADRRADVAGLVLVATPGLPPAETLRSQLQAIEEPLRTKALTILDEIAAGRTVEAIPQPLLPLFRLSVQPFLRTLFVVRPAPVLTALELPTLVIGGGNDLQVGRADFDALTAVQPDVESRWFPNMNHVLVDAPVERAGNFATYADSALSLTSGLADTIAAFARRQ